MNPGEWAELCLHGGCGRLTYHLHNLPKKHIGKPKGHLRKLIHALRSDKGCLFPGLTMQPDFPEITSHWSTQILWWKGFLTGHWMATQGQKSPFPKFTTPCILVILSVNYKEMPSRWTKLCKLAWTPAFTRIANSWKWTLLALCKWDLHRYRACSSAACSKKEW